MLSFIKKTVLILLSLFIVSCANESNDENNIDNTFELAAINNGNEDLDYTKYENYWTYPVDGELEADYFIPNWNGICDRLFQKKGTSYKTENETGCCFSVDQNIKWRYGQYLKVPYCFFYEYNKHELELKAGTFKLFKKNGDFYITVIIDKYRDPVKCEWVASEPKSETYKYIVSKDYLVLIKL